MLIFPVLVLPLSRSLGLSLDKVLGLSFLMYLLYGLAAIPWGFISDKTSPRIVMGTGIVIAGTGLIFSGLVRNSYMLSWTLAVTGLGCAAYHPSGLALVSKGIKSRGRGLGINGIFGNLGMAAAPFTAGVMNYFLGWRQTLIFLGIAGIFAGLLSLFVKFSVPRDGDLQKGEKLKEDSMLKLFLVLCVVVLFSGLMYRTYTLVFPAWIETKLGSLFTFIEKLIDGNNSIALLPQTDTLIASIITGSAYVIGMFGQFTGGKIADKWELRSAYLFFWLMALPFLLLARFSTGLWVLPFAGLFIFFAMGMQPIENSIYAILTPARWRSVGYGIKFTLTLGIGSLSVYIVKQVEPTIGLDGIIILTAVYLLITTAAAFILRLIHKDQQIKHS
ncbi:MAG: MFS transporter [Spirochaetaceae bacterium]|nr:MFS transporter [Spirochaetaceae bacterium]